MIIIKWWVGGVHKICSLKNITTDGWVGECMCLCVCVCCLMCMELMLNLPFKHLLSFLLLLVRLFFSVISFSFFILWLVFIYQPTLLTYSQLFSYVFVVSFFECLQPFCFVLFRMVHVFCPFPTYEKWTQIVIKTNNFFCFEIGQLSHTQCGVWARVKEN